MHDGKSPIYPKLRGRVSSDHSDIDVWVIPEDGLGGGRRSDGPAPNLPAPVCPAHPGRLRLLPVRPTELTMYFITGGH